MTGRGQRRMSHAARIATAIHIIWKYLFMSNSTALTHDDVRDDEQRDEPRDEEPARRQPARRSTAATSASANGMPEVRRVEEERRRAGRRRTAASLQPATNRNAPTWPCWKTASAMNGTARTSGAEEEHRVAASRRRAPGAGRHDVQADDQVGRRERVELEWRQERGEEAGQEHAGRPPPEARDDEQDRPRPARAGRASRPGGAGSRSRAPMRSGRTASRPPSCCRTGTGSRAPRRRGCPPARRRPVASSPSRRRGRPGSRRWRRPGGRRSGAGRGPRRRAP